MGATADLAEFRLLRALRAGQPGAFPTLWNAQAGATWSVVRALCATDAEAIGWVTTFRVELSQNVDAFDVADPIAAQVGRALYRHLHDAFDRDAALPDGRLAADEAGLRRVPEHPRLVYLVDLFFDLRPEDLVAVAGKQAPDTYERVRRLFEPGDDTDARLTVHAALLRTPPADALFLPPGDEPPEPRLKRWWPLAVGGLVTLLLVAVFAWSRASTVDWRDLAALHDAALASQPVLGGDGAELSREIVRHGAPALLAEVPDLEAAGLTLLGAWFGGGREVVVLLYHGRDGTWTLQHHLHGPAPEGAPLARADGLAVHDAGGHPAAVWTESGATWSLVADAPPERVLEVARRIRELRHPTGVPFLGNEGGVTPGAGFD